MQFICETCRANLQIADEKLRGKRLIVRCKRCGVQIRIADPALAAPPQPAISGAQAAPRTAAPPPPLQAFASEPESPHATPSSVPLKPPNETPTSPPAWRVVVTMAATWVSVATGAVPSHAGEQPPPDSTNAKMKFRSPLWAITSERF